MIAWLLQIMHLSLISHQPASWPVVPSLQHSSNYHLFEQCARFQDWNPYLLRYLVSGDSLAIVLKRCSVWPDSLIASTTRPEECSNHMSHS